MLDPAVMDDPAVMYNPAVMDDPDLKIYDYEPEEDFLLGLPKGPIDIYVSVIQINAKRIHVEPRVLTITCDPRTETVGSLKKMLEDMTNLPADKQKLNGKVGYMTSNSLTLAAYNVGNADQLFLGYSENGDGNCKGGGAGGGGSGFSPVPGEVRGGPFSLMRMYDSYEFLKEESLDEGQIDISPQVGSLILDPKQQSLDEDQIEMSPRVDSSTLDPKQQSLDERWSSSSSDSPGPKLREFDAGKSNMSPLAWSSSFYRRNRKHGKLDIVQIDSSSSSDQERQELDAKESDMLSDTKQQNLDEEEDYDGWQDEWDKVFDLRAASKEYMKSMNEFYKSIRFPQLFIRHQTMCQTRGYDPIPLGVDRDDRYMEDLDLDRGECMITVTEVAAHAVNLYNHRKSKNLEFVRVTKASKVWGLGDEIQRLFFVTFLAREKGNPYTLKFYQTRAQTTYHYAIVDIMSFRPKPI